MQANADKDYPPLDSYGMIGNMRTIALSGLNGSIDYMCYPRFDSPSIFARVLDCKKGGHYSINLKEGAEPPSIKQKYLPKSCMLATKYVGEDSACQVVDYMYHPSSKSLRSDQHLLPWVMRHVTVIRGRPQLEMELFPSFEYGLHSHTTEFVPDSNTVDDKNSKVGKEKAVFTSEKLAMDLRYILYHGEDSSIKPCTINWKIEDRSDQGLKGPGIVADLCLEEGQEIVLVFRQVPEPGEKLEEQQSVSILRTLVRNMDPKLSHDIVNILYNDTHAYWKEWIKKCTYQGMWREAVHRSAFTLKLLTYAPTGAVVAAPTFSFPEFIGGTRNWDYRFTWIRDASFTIYAFIRLGYTDEAHAFMEWIENRLMDLNPDGSLSIMYDIHGNTELEELELDHLDGYKGSKPVRIGNGAADHLQLDIYGELLDSIYLSNKFGKPLSYDKWKLVRKIVDYVVENWNREDMSIWEVRNNKQNFLYSKIMCWVALDRGLRLADKRNLPLPQRSKWLECRDTIYEEVMEKGWNSTLKTFQQSYESPETIDASVLIMPLVFFISPTDPRLLSTIQKILTQPEKGGLTINNLVYRYNHQTSHDGVGGEEGAFSMCTFWLVEALTRAGEYDPKLLDQALNIFEEMQGYANHLRLYSEEVSKSGVALGNFPQVTLNTIHHVHITNHTTFILGIHPHRNDFSSFQLGSSIN